jgi:hypothetical protein
VNFLLLYREGKSRETRFEIKGQIVTYDSRSKAKEHAREHGYDLVVPPLSKEEVANLVYSDTLPQEFKRQTEKTIELCREAAGYAAELIVRYGDMTFN